MTPTHKPEDGDRAPISNRGAALETAWKFGNGFALYHWSASHVQTNYRDGCNQCYADAAALLAEKAQRIERLEAALRECLDDLEYLAKAPDSAYARPDDSTLELARAALSQPHLHEG